MAENKVIYRRVKGRIVPIKVKSSADKRRRNFGIGSIAAGLGISGIATRTSHNMKRAAGRAESIAKKSIFSSKNVRTRNFLFKAGDPTLFHHARRAGAANKILGIGVKAGKRAKKLRMLAPHMKSFGILAGSSLIGSGLGRVFEGRDESDVTGTIKELGFTAATGAALYGSGDKAIRAKAGRALARILSKGKIK